MFKIFCVTNRKICAEDASFPRERELKLVRGEQPLNEGLGDIDAFGGFDARCESFLLRIEKLAEARPAAIILREPDLEEWEYEMLASRVRNICHQYDVECFLHKFFHVAYTFREHNLLLPLPILRNMLKWHRQRIHNVGASCHSVEEAREAEALGAKYIVAGHIFDTPSKEGIPGRGLDFLTEVCESVPLPVYAIGGISDENIAQVRRAGAQGVCIMRDCMQRPDIWVYIQRLKKEKLYWGRIK